LALQENGLGRVRDFLDEWERLKHLLHESAVAEVRRLTLVTGTLFAPTLRRVAGVFARRTGIAVTVLPVINHRLGATITVAGLLMGQDVIQALQAVNADALGEWIVLPRVMFDHPDGIALDDVSPDQIAQATGRPVLLADGMADIWHALTGPFHPSG
jgi:NifB/MoaA-like Fe-S oxidoreductase